VAVTAPAGVGTPERGSDHDRITEAGHGQKVGKTAKQGRREIIHAAQGPQTGQGSSRADQARRTRAEPICRTGASRAAFIAHCYQEALAITEEHKLVVLALSQALIDHHERTLHAAESDAVISQTLARQALAAEQVRRASWRQVTERVAEITS